MENRSMTLLGVVTWFLMGGSIYCFWSYDWRLGLGIVLAMLSVGIDFGRAFQILQERIDAVNARFTRG